MKHKPDAGSKPPTIDLDMVALENGELGPVFEPVNTLTSKHSCNSPGGRVAKKKGCTCPVIHDERGNTVLLVDGHRMMIYRKGCPVHSPKYKPPRPEKMKKVLKDEKNPGLYTFDNEMGILVKVADIKVKDDKSGKT